MAEQMNNRSFQELQTAVFDAYYNQEYQRALDLLEGHNYPAQKDRIINWQACFLSRLGRHQEAEVLLREAVEEGVWWQPGQLQDDEDFAPLQNSPGFQRVVRICQERLEQEQACAKPELLVWGANGQVGPKPLLLSIHWWGDNAHDFADLWPADVWRDYLVAFPQSS